MSGMFSNWDVEHAKSIQHEAEVSRLRQAAASNHNAKVEMWSEVERLREEVRAYEALADSMTDHDRLYNAVANALCTLRRQLAERNSWDAEGEES